MVSRTLGTRHTLRVPCAGGVSPGRWLAWIEAAEPAQIEIIDRGWCSGCPVGCGEANGHAAAPALESVRRWLSVAGMPDGRLPRIVVEPLAPNLRPAEFPRPVEAESIGRRDFFRRFADRFHAAAKPSPAQAHYASIAAIRRTAHVQPEHGLRLAALTRCAERHGGGVHPELLPSVTLDHGCAGHGVCAGACPTGALRLVTGAVAEGLAFDATLCTACGQCERLCPEKAIHLDLERCGPAGYALVSRRELLACPGCGTAHAGDEPLCPRCAAGQRLAHDLFSPAGHGRTNQRSITEVIHHE